MINSSRVVGTIPWGALFLALWGVSGCAVHDYVPHTLPIFMRDQKAPVLANPEPEEYAPVQFSSLRLGKPVVLPQQETNPSLAAAGSTQAHDEQSPPEKTGITLEQ